MRRIHPERLAERLEARLNGDLEDGRVGGAGLCVLQDGREVCRRYAGAMSAASGTPLAEVGDRTMFRLASMTKPVTAVAALIQADRGLLDLDAPIDALLPEFSDLDIGRVAEGRVARVGKARARITPTMLLSHTSGIGSGETGEIQMSRMGEDDRADLSRVTRYISRCALAFEPLSAEAYSPLWAFDVLGRLIELTSGQPLDRFLAREVLAPCGMEDATFSPTEEQWDRMIAMHDRRVQDGRGRSVDAPSPSRGEMFPCGRSRGWIAGGGGLASTLPDYVRFAEMLRRGGVAGDGRRILSERSALRMRTPAAPKALWGPTQTWGLGVRVITGAGTPLPVGTFGWSGAFGTHFFVDPANGITAVYMKNSLYDGGAGAVTAARFEEDVYASAE